MVRAAGGGGSGVVGYAAVVRVAESLACGARGDECGGGRVWALPWWRAVSCGAGVVGGDAVVDDEPRGSAGSVGYRVCTAVLSLAVVVES